MRDNEKKLFKKIFNKIENDSDKKLKSFMKKILSHETGGDQSRSWENDVYPSIIKQVLKEKP